MALVLASRVCLSAGRVGQGWPGSLGGGLSSPSRSGSAAKWSLSFEKGGGGGWVLASDGPAKGTAQWGRGLCSSCH